MADSFRSALADQLDVHGDLGTILFVRVKQDASTQDDIDMDRVEVEVADAVVAEAVQFGRAAEERADAAEQHVQHLQAQLDMALRHALMEATIADKEMAQEQAARRVLEKLLAAEAAALDAAEGRCEDGGNDTARDGPAKLQMV